LCPTQPDQNRLYYKHNQGENMSKEKLIAILLEALEGLTEDYWETLGDAYVASDGEGFGAYDKAIEAIMKAREQKQ